MDRKEVVRLSQEYGGAWIVGHAERLIRLVEIIGEGLTYNRDVIWIAAYLHDWGACPKWTREGVSHSLRSRQLAETYLKRAKCPHEWVGPILEAIEFHHGGAADRCPEAILLADADALDSLGVIGVLKEFAMIPAEVKGDYSLPLAFGMREAREMLEIRRENNLRMLKLEKSRQLAAERVAEMEKLFAILDRETFGQL